MIFLVSLYGFFIPVPSPEYEWNISYLFLPTRSLRIFRVQYFDDLKSEQAQSDFFQFTPTLEDVEEKFYILLLDI